MTLVLSGAPDARAKFSPLKAFVNMIRAARRSHMQRIALAELMQMDDMRLTDLGLSRADIVAALNAGQTHSLNARRARL